MCCVWHGYGLKNKRFARLIKEAIEIYFPQSKGIETAAIPDGETATVDREVYSSVRLIQVVGAGKK